MSFHFFERYPFPGIPGCPGKPDILKKGINLRIHLSILPGTNFIWWNVIDGSKVCRTFFLIVSIIFYVNIILLTYFLHCIIIQSLFHVIINKIKFQLLHLKMKVFYKSCFFPPTHYQLLVSKSFNQDFPYTTRQRIWKSNFQIFFNHGEHNSVNIGYSGALHKRQIWRFSSTIVKVFLWESINVKWIWIVLELQI